MDEKPKLPPPTDERAKKLRTYRRLLLPAAAALLFVGLWLWNCGVYYRTLPCPSLGIGVSKLSCGIAAVKQGVSIGASLQRSASFGIRIRGIGPYVRFPHADEAHFAGFTVAILTREYDGGDYKVYPHCGLIVPYWFLTAASIFVFLRRLRAAGMMPRWQRTHSQSSGEGLIP